MVGDRRELRLVEEGSPCDVNFFDSEILTVRDAMQGGRSRCPNYNNCMKEGSNNYCALGYGQMVASYVMKGGSLKNELLEFLEAPHVKTQKYWNSVDRRSFHQVQGKARVVRAVEGFARVVLLEDPFESSLDTCKKCDGIKLEKTVTDSGRDGVGLLSGSGKVRSRLVSYCPDCEPEPRNGTFEESVVDDLF